MNLRHYISNWFCALTPLVYSKPLTKFWINNWVEIRDVEETSLYYLTLNTILSLVTSAVSVNGSKSGPNLSLHFFFTSFLNITYFFEGLYFTKKLYMKNFYINKTNLPSRCADGFFGSPLVPGNFCQPCDCSGNVSPIERGTCDPVTGRCLKCLGNTAGWRCEKCMENHFGDPLRWVKKDKIRTRRVCILN